MLCISWRLYPLIMVQLLSITDAKKTMCHNRLNLSVSLGWKTELFCNCSLDNVEHITWRKDNGVIFTFSKDINKTFENFSSERMRIDPKHPRKLQIAGVQMSDVGIYLCYAHSWNKTQKTEWMLSVKGADNGSQSQRNTKEIIMYSVPAALVGGICVIVGICCVLHLLRKRNGQNNENDGDVGGQEVEVIRRVRKSHSTQYLEKTNSVYGR